MHVRMPKLVESQVGSAGGAARGSASPPSPAGCRNPPSRSPTRTRGGGHAKPRPTRGPAVTTLLVSRHVLHLADDQLGELLHAAVHPAARCCPTAVGIPLEGVAQGFVLAVLQHRDPPGQGGSPIRKKEEEDRESRAGSSTARSGDGLRHLHNTLLLVLCLEVIRPVVCRDRERGEKVRRGCPGQQEGAETTPKGLL